MIYPYNETCERLWEKLQFYREEFKHITKKDLHGFLADSLAEQWPKFNELVLEVEEEFSYSMSEFQCSWAVNQYVDGGLRIMEEYNKAQGTNLKPRK